MTHIINLSLSHGIIPDEMKIARVIPIFKAGDQAVITNYRPVSILPCFSKILEKVIYKRLLNYVNDLGIFCNNQYGFRKGHSTSLALIDLFDNISSAIDRKEHSVGIFLDLSKAFDTVDHNILLDKLNYYGIRGLALDLIKSYLSDRMQYVQYNQTGSIRQNISCGVPQGSILGPLLFLLYINDLANVSKLLTIILFADDTNIFYSHNDPATLIRVLKEETEKLSEWFKANKLSLNLDKTKYMLFSPKQKKARLNINLFINNHEITQVSEIVFLGVVLDQHLSWKPQIAQVANKISKSIGVIYKSSFYLFKESMHTLYFSLVYPYLYYCNLVWASTYQSNLHRIILLQKRAVRVLSRSNFDAHTDPIFKELHIIKFRDICSLQIGQFMFSYKHGLLPASFDTFFTLNSEIHNYLTRNAKSFHLPLCRTNICQFSIRYQGPKFFNSLGDEIVNSVSFQSFTFRLKAYLFEL